MTKRSIINLYFGESLGPLLPTTQKDVSHARVLVFEGLAWGPLVLGYTVSFGNLACSGHAGMRFDL